MTGSKQGRRRRAACALAVSAFAALALAPSSQATNEGGGGGGTPRARTAFIEYGGYYVNGQLRAWSSAVNATADTQNRVTGTSQIKDFATDGYCALMTIKILDFYKKSIKTLTPPKECGGLWTPVKFDSGVLSTKPYYITRRIGNTSGAGTDSELSSFG
jgi:hypothetical protein